MISEIALIIVFLLLLILPKRFIGSIKKPYDIYVKWGLGMVLIGVVWWAMNDGKMSMKIMLTIVVLYSLMRGHNYGKEV
ncbi:hypothetical protein [Membranihabitans maritimus]|uniref:hypothetical protein n=1 Tax=Membranihabitans maritimus TaxID=2904244 RepID=UPI001F2E64C4|nr:hypothetical protein [Membranihabitans maritimus]